MKIKSDKIRNNETEDFRTAYFDAFERQVRFGQFYFLGCRC